MFLLFAVPAFLVVAALSVRLASRSGGFRTTELNPRKRVLFNVAGFIAATALTLFAVQAVPRGSNSDWGPFVIYCGVVILGPFVFGATLLSLRGLFDSLRPPLVSIAAGALLASAFSPVVVPFVSWGYVIVQYPLDLNSLCRNAFVEIIERAEKAKSVAFLPDSFVEPPVNYQSTIQGFSSFVLNQSLVEFIERPATEESGLKGKAKFERVTTSGERVLTSRTRNEKSKFIYEPIETITADYIVQPKSIVVQNSQEPRLGGATIDIYRRADNTLISRTQYYWSDDLYRSCPVETRAGMFVYKFIADSLGISNPKGAIAALPH